MVHSLSNIDTLLKLYRVAFRIRYVELEIAREYSKGEMRCPVHLSVGQEMTSAVFSIFQTSLDFAVSTHRAHAHYLAKGGNLEMMLAEIYGRETGCSRGRGGSMHLSDPSVNFMGSSAIVGNSIPVGVGIAYGIRLVRSKNRSFIFLGDGATEEGVFYESLNFAVLHELPAVFIVENNFYSVYTNLGVRQPKRSLSQLASTIGMNSAHIEFGDFEGLFDAFVAMDSLSRDKPLLLEIDTYRWLEHCGPNRDDDLQYREDSELNKHLSFDILEELKSRILTLNESYHTSIGNIEKEVRFEVSAAFEFARNSPFPSVISSKGDFYEW